MTETAIIIVNWNGKKYLRSCLDSLEKQTYKNFNIILVDNASTDNSLGNISPKKNLKIVRNKQNLGFANGNNIGIKYAIERGCRYIGLLNYDTEVDPLWLESLTTTLKGDAKCAASQSLILLDKSHLINSNGNALHFLGFSYCGGYKSQFNTNTQEADLVLISGAACLFEASALEKSGLFDGDFFMYHEDVDLSWRLKELGYTLKLQPKSIVYHKYSFSRNTQKFYLSEKNRLIFIFKNYQTKTLLLLSPALLLTEILMLFYSLFGGWAGSKVRGYGDIFRSREAIIAKRRTIQANRVSSDRDLKKYFSTELKFGEIKSPLFTPLNAFYKLYWVLVKSLI
jgi:hypothetical protein